MTKTRNRWAHCFTLATLAASVAAAAVWSAPASPSRATRSGTAVRPLDRAAPKALIPGLAQKLAGLDEAHRAMLERRIELAESGAASPFSACFAPGTPNEVMEAYRAAEAAFRPFDDRFQNGARWVSTAYTPVNTPVGTPIVISYSIVPDGTPVPGFNGEAAAVSNLRAYLNGIYGSQAVWLPVLQSCFDRWSQVSGIRYVFEVNDDGVELGSAVGVPNVRGDCRISGHLIDGNSNVLAYNFYPDNPETGFGGDMVIDTGDNFFADTSNNSVRLRDVIMHEHGHGMGQAHVCPIETTKLMEPFVATNFDGPRHDDIRQAQYLYGDVNEPNNFAAQATDLGSLDCGTISVGDMPAPAGLTAGAIAQTPIASTVSLADIADDDLYAIHVSAPTQISVTATPLGLEYDDSAQACAGQSASCCSGSPVDSRSTVDLAINILQSDGTTLIASATATGVGQAERLADISLPEAGTYYIQIKPENAIQSAQFYHLDISSSPATVLAGLTGDSNISVPAGELIPVGLKINDGSESFDPATSHFYYSLDGGSNFVEAPIYSQGGGGYIAALADIPCGGTIQFYVEIRSTEGSLVRLPCSGVYTPRTGDVFNIYSTDFTSNAGWVVGPNSATTGIWEDVVPIGSAAQPGADHTGPGGKCFVTGQGAISNGPGSFDIDGGSTLLTSPAMNLSGMSDAEISYWRWYSNGAGAAPYSDTFIIQASVNGGTSWTTAETVGPGSVNEPNTNPGWRFKSFKLSSIGLTPSANVKVRFNAQDTGSGSVVEAALDDFAVIGFKCLPVAWCEGDMNLDNVVDDNDFVIFANAYNILDCADPSMPAGCPSDINADGVVDDSDFVAFATAYNELICP